MDELIGMGGVLGETVAGYVLSIAGILKEGAAPGLACLAIVFLLAVFSWCYLRSASRIKRAIKNAQSALGTKSDPREFAAAYTNASNQLKLMEQQDKPAKQIGTAWREFEETLLPYGSDESLVYNTVRPSFFFSREDLGIEDSFWRYVPTLFVSVGLFLTFLGLVAALDSASGTLKAASGDGGTTQALTELLAVASAKFIMSLTGLLCSILFTLLHRREGGKIDARLHELCVEIERRVIYRTPESLLVSIMNQSREQTEQLKTFGHDLAAQIGKDIREAAEGQGGRIDALSKSLSGDVSNLKSSIEETIPRAITDAMDPVVQKLEEQRKTGVSQIADGLGDRLTDSVKTAMEEMRATLQDVGETMQTLAGRMDSSAGNMTAQVDQAVQALAREIARLGETMGESTRTAVDTLNQGSETLLQRMEESLQAIRANTSESGEALARSALAMSEAADALSKQIEAAGQAASESAGATIDAAAAKAGDHVGEAGQRVTAAMAEALETLNGQADAFSTTFQSDLLAPLDALRSELASLRDGIARSSDSVGRYSNAVGDSAAAIESANGELAGAANALTAAAGPIASASGNIEASHQEMRRVIEDTASTLRDGIARTNSATVAAIETARDGIREQQQLVASSTDAVRTAVDDFSNIVNRYQDIDDQLGKAFSQIQTSVDRSVNEIKDFTEKLNKDYSEALSVLNEIISRTEPFPGPDGA